MAKTYGLVFTTSDPRTVTGLTPTLVQFWDMLTGATLPPPGVTEFFTGSGVYQFSYAATGPVYFLADGGVIVADADRYLEGILDPIQSVDERLGTVADSFGSTSIDPTTAIGYLKRLQEWLEGNANFAKSTGTWTVFSRGGSTLLQTKTLTNTTSNATKT